MMIKGGSYKTVNFMTHGPVILMLGPGHISHYTEKASYFTQYTPD